MRRVGDRYVVWYPPDLFLLAEHRWQFAAWHDIAARGDLHAQVFGSARAAWRAIDTWTDGRTFLRPLKVA